MQRLNITTKAKFWFLIILFFTHSIVFATTIVVDRDDDLTVASGGGCSLRNAIDSANMNLALENCVAGDAFVMDVIIINVVGPIQLTSQIDIYSSMSISPNTGEHKVTIKAATNSRIFAIHPISIDDDNIQLERLRFIDGDAGIENGGAILFSDFPIYSNNAEAAIIRLINLEFENNQADEGGAINFIDVNASEILIEQSKFIGNMAIKAGAIYGEDLTHQGSFNLNNNVFKSNITTLGSGGAIYIKDTNIIPYEINKNLFWGNISASTAGAMMLVKLSGPMQYNLASNVFLQNHSSASGVAIYLNLMDLYLTNNTFAFNSASSGAAIYSWNGHIQKIVNSTFLYNEASSTGSAQLQIEGVTDDDSLEIGTSIFANPIGDNNNCNLSLSIASSMGSNISDDTSCDFDHVNDVIADPQLSGLVYHDSGLPGFIPTANSPALDSNLTTDCFDNDGVAIIEFDQQGNPRTTDGDNDGTAYCDSGAIEAPYNSDLIWADSLGG